MLVRAAASGRLPLLRLLLRRAAPAAPALAPLVRCPPARGFAGVRRNNALAFFVKREVSANYAEVTVPAGASVAALIEAALAKLRIDASPDSVTLAPIAATSGSPPLDPTLLLSEALTAGALTPRAKLLVTVCSSIVGTMPHDSELGIPVAVWARMGPLAQEATRNAGLQRRRLSTLKVLTSLGTPIPVSGATEYGVTVLREGLGGSIALGAFNLPFLDSKVVDFPKGFDDSLGFFSDAPCFLLQAQRVMYSAEFVRSLKPGGSKAFGVLLSGPNGVGKSGVGLLAFLACYAQQIPVVYIPAARNWAEAAGRGHGDNYFLQVLWNQNADLIAASFELRAVFSFALRDEEPDSGAMQRLRQAIRTGKCAKIGVIVDEAQRLSTAVTSGSEQSATASLKVTGEYFLNGWYDWENPNKIFSRMSIASAHGNREFSLPSGEDSRLRFVLPWASIDIDALALHARSPFFISSERARASILSHSGGIIRVLNRGRLLLAESGADMQGLAIVEMHLRSAMASDCERWLLALSDSDRVKALNLMLPLARGQVSWTAVKGLYDSGLVARHDASFFVRPVSPVAASVLLEVFARYSLHSTALVNLSGAERGFELERRVFCALLLNKGLFLSAQALSGRRVPNVGVLNDFHVFFRAESELKVQKGVSVLYVPHDATYACDFISVPSDEKLPIQLIEVSATNPRERVAKVLKWFAPGRLLDKLTALHPSRTFECVFIFSGLFAETNRSSGRYTDIDAAAALCGKNADGCDIVSCVVISEDGLEALGISV